MNRRGAYQKKAQNIGNVQARHDLLLAGLAEPGKVSPAVAKSLSGQRTFARLTLRNSKVGPISLNTLKVLAAELYSDKAGSQGDGFGYLETLRKKLKALVDTMPSGRSVEAKSRRHLEKSDDLDNQLDAVKQQNLRQTKAYGDLYSKLHLLLQENWIEEAAKLRLINILGTHLVLYGDLFNPVGVSDSGDSAVVLNMPTRSENQ